MIWRELIWHLIFTSWDHAVSNNGTDDMGGFVVAADRSEFTGTEKIQPHFKLLYTEVGKIKKLLQKYLMPSTTQILPIGTLIYPERPVATVKSS